MKIIQIGLLLALLKLSGTNVAAKDSDNIGSVRNKPCRARAWVRAPDLEPGQVVQGDVKVKLDGACEKVHGYTLKLRFAERSWVKTKRQGVQIPKPPAQRHFKNPRFTNATNANPSNCCMNGFSESPETRDLAWDEYLNIVQDPSLWLQREEERIGFEAKYNLCDGKPIGHDVVEPFAILVPSTLYPPAFSLMYRQVLPVSFDGEIDATGSEHVYAYAVDVVFADGTILEVPAGHTTFNPRIKLTSPSEPETVHVTASRTLPYIEGNGLTSEVLEPKDVDNFILEVTFPHGRRLEQGSLNNITVVSHRVGPGTERADSVRCGIVTVPKRHWAASLATDNETGERLLNAGLSYSSQLKPTNFSTNNLPQSFHNSYQSALEIPKFPLDGEVVNGTTFSTRPVVTQFYTWDNLYPNFQMHYQAIEVELSINLGVVDISPVVGNEEETDTVLDEYDWIPDMKTRHSNCNDQSLRILSARIPLFIYPRQDDPSNSATTENVHYLSQEARAPVFVDPASVQDLLQKYTEERNALSPKAQPEFITHEGDVVRNRYFAWGQPEMYYVGDTWLRKVVLPRKRNEEEGQAGGHRIQS